MKYYTITPVVISLLVLTSSSFSQDKKTPVNENRINKVDKTNKISKIDKQVPDVRIIHSGSSYIEFEYTPGYVNEKDFLNAASDSRKPGEPDVMIKSFPLFFPVHENNRIEVLDSRYEDIPDTDIHPVPVTKRDKNHISGYQFIKDEKVYGQNAFFPSSPAVLTAPGIVRDKYLGYAYISPVMYNPAARVLRKYSYIRFRVIYGGSPFASSKPLSREEYSFFRNLALNFNPAVNWSVNANTGQRNNINSVLANGNFYRIEIKETGIYKLDKTFLQNAGINLQGVDPRNIKIYGNGGKELPYNNNAPAPEDLIENRIFIPGENDGTFDDGDYIVFYGRSPHDIEYNASARSYQHYINHYSNSNYYFITFEGAPGQRMSLVPSPNIQGAPLLDYCYNTVFEEPEVNNLGSTGTLWLSSRVSTGESFVYNKDLKGYKEGTEIKLNIRIGNGSHDHDAVYKITDENSSYSALFNIGHIPFSSERDFVHINLSYLTASYPLFSGSSRLKMSLNSNDNHPDAAGYLDYFAINYKRSLTSAENNYISINSPDTTGVFEYNVSPFNNSDVKVFNVTNSTEPYIVNPISAGSGTVKFQAQHTSKSINKFIAASPDAFKTPAPALERVGNQNIHGIKDGASFVIISPTEFMPAANRLKAYRESSGQNSLKTFVFDINQLYNEFSGGLQDPVAVRNFLKYAYHNWNERPVYVLFMGDGNYDYKNLYNINIKNWLPPVQKTTDDIHEINSFPSDDFAADINEVHETPVAVIPDFATGRLCVNSLEEANSVIDKIQAYESPAGTGLWKKKIMYVADDGWTTTYTNGEEGSLHTGQSEIIAQTYTSPDFDKEKIYIVTYPSVITPQGRRKPDANPDIIRGWNEGRSMINYVGHGSTDKWAHEEIFHLETTIPQINNKNKYPLVTIASCDLARYDDPYSTSAAELLVNLHERGAIGIIAAVRPVFSGQNAAFNQRLWQSFFFEKDTLNLPLRAGLSMFNTKASQVANDNNAKFVLLCDPTLRIGVPQYFTQVDSINNVPGSETATIKGLQKVTFHGKVLNPDSSFWGGFNGKIDVKIFDVERQVTVMDFNHPFNFVLDGGKIFAGKTDVINGLWKVEFIVPKDISYANGRGKLTAYINDGTHEGSGYTNNFILNGLDSTARADTTGPEITVFMGDRNFRNGDIVNQNTTILADFFDESGINLTGTTGHKIEAVINNDESKKLDLTTYYSSTTNYQNGVLEYPLQNLADGSYSLKIQAWDTYNNYSTATVDFSVANNSSLQVQKVYNYPNPMADNTSFLFNHNFDLPLDIKIKIYTVSGRLIKELNKTNITDKFVQIEWDGRDNDGDNIANGVYLYRLAVKSQDGSLSSNLTGKLAKLK